LDRPRGAVGKDPTHDGVSDSMGVDFVFAASYLVL
jgi:hypothetical protein